MAPHRPRRSTPFELLLPVCALALVACPGVGVEPDGGHDPGGAVCGGLDRPCCEGAYPCVGNLICAGAEGETPLCHAGCLPSLCETSEATPRPGTCQDVSDGAGLGVCVHAYVPSSCDPSSLAPCVTEYGVAGICVSDGWSSYCFEECAPAATGCDDAHLCVALASPSPDGIEGVCVGSGS